MEKHRGTSKSGGGGRVCDLVGGGGKPRLAGGVPIARETSHNYLPLEMGKEVGSVKEEGELKKTPHMKNRLFGKGAIRIRVWK